MTKLESPGFSRGEDVNFTVLRDAVGVVCELQDTSNYEDGSSSDWFAVGDGRPTTVELPAFVLYAPGRISRAGGA